MLDHERDDIEFFAAIKGYLAQQKEDKDTTDLKAATEAVTDLLGNDQEIVREEVIQLAKLWTLRPDFTSKVILQEQAVKHSPEIAEQTKQVLSLIDKIGYAAEGIYEVARADNGITHIPRTASIRQIPLPLPIDKIMLHQFTPEGLRYMPEVANALGIQAEDGLFTRISVMGVASGLTDRQTRSAMEQIFLRCPSAAQTLTVDINTEYFIFGNKIGKVINRPAPLLAERALDFKSRNFSAISEFTPGDDYLARLALKSLTDKLLNLI
jgi:hypothetical protein